MFTEMTAPEGFTPEAVEAYLKAHPRRMYVPCSGAHCIVAEYLTYYHTNTERTSTGLDFSFLYGPDHAETGQSVRLRNPERIKNLICWFDGYWDKPISGFDVAAQMSDFYNSELPLEIEPPTAASEKGGDATD